MSTSLHAALHATATQLVDHSDAPRREAELLLEHLTGLSRSQQLINENQLLDDDQVATLKTLTERRISGKPLAYLLGEQHFWTLRLKVSPEVLIPRPETELVVERALHHTSRDFAGAILDLGTGSGAIALAVAQERPTATVVATDQSNTVLDTARRNAELNQLNNVRFLLSDWLDQVPLQPFALILSNPPYIANDDPHVEPAVRQHEPALALFSGIDGLDAIRRIVQNAPRFLADQGWLVLEHGWQQAAAVRELLESTGFSGVASHADLAGHLRVTEGQWPGTSIPTQHHSPP